MLNYRVTAVDDLVCFTLIVCVTGPTESPGDDQRGVWGFARLETGELEESQRTILNGRNREPSYRHQDKPPTRRFVSPFAYNWRRQRLSGSLSRVDPVTEGRGSWMDERGNGVVESAGGRRDSFSCRRFPPRLLFMLVFWMCK